MTTISEEVKLWNNSLIGAYLLWRFTGSYVENHSEGASPVGILHFIALPLLMSPSYSEKIIGHRPNLQSFARGFKDNKFYDQLLFIQNCVNDQKQFTLTCIDLATSKGMLVWNKELGTIHYGAMSAPTRGYNEKASVKNLGTKAELLGKWFSEHSLSSITRYLQVAL